MATNKANQKALAQIFGEDRMDAAFSLGIDLDLQAIESEVYRVEYADLKARQWLPLKSDVPAGAETFAYKIMDMFGRAEFVSDWSDELPMVGLRAEKRVGQIFSIANAYGYSRQDLRAAAMMGISLDREEAQAALRGHEERMNSAALLGVPALGLIGFFNHPDVVVLAASDWDSGATTGDTMLADVRRFVNQVVTQSQGKFIPNQMILPLSSYNQLFAKPVNTAGSTQDTVGLVFQRGLPSPIKIDWDINLETAGVGGTKRGIVYQKDPRVAQLVVPMEPEILPAQEQNLTLKKPVESRTGGSILRQPLACAYFDGL